MATLLSRKSIFYKWFPVLPFLGYWVFSFLMFEFGLFKTPEVSVLTIAFFWVCLGAFAFAYFLGIETRSRGQFKGGVPAKSVVSLLKLSSFMFFIGTVLILVDKFMYGAASVDAVANDLYTVREDLVQNTSLVTTLAVLPQSFKLIALAAYFYCVGIGLRVPRYCSFLIVSSIVVEIAIMVFSANRGALFWIAMYILFYVIYCKRVNVFKDAFSVKGGLKKLLFVLFVVASFSYFVFVAKNREVESSTIYRGVEASYLLKYPSLMENYDYAELAGQYQLFYYVTHGFEYTNAILAQAPLINFDLLSPLGIRVEAQIQRFIPGYVHPAKQDILEAIRIGGLSSSGWPSIFGASAAFFGVLGAPFFFAVVGGVAGVAARNFIQFGSFAWLLLVFSIFCSLNMSFDWIVRNFDQFAAVGVSLYYLVLKNRATN